MFCHVFFGNSLYDHDNNELQKQINKKTHVNFSKHWMSDNQLPFQEPKLEVPTIYKAYIMSVNFAPHQTVAIHLSQAVFQALRQQCALPQWSAQLSQPGREPWRALEMEGVSPEWLWINSYVPAILQGWSRLMASVVFGSCRRKVVLVLNFCWWTARFLAVFFFCFFQSFPVRLRIFWLSLTWKHMNFKP